MKHVGQQTSKNHREAGISPQALSYLESIARICEATAWSDDYKDIYQNIVYALAEALQVEFVNLYIFDVDGDQMTTFATHASDEFMRLEDIKAAGSVSVKKTIGRMKRLIETWEPIVMDYFSPHPQDEIPTGVLEDGFWGAITVPLLAGDVVLGIFNIVHLTEREWPAGELEYLKIIGRILGTSIQRAQSSRKYVDMAILNERKFLSSELHDHLAQSVNSLKICIETTLMQLEENRTEDIHASFSRTEAACRQSLQLLREEMLVLRIPSTSADDLIPSIRDVLDAFSRNWLIQADLVVEGGGEPTLAAHNKMQLTRILHECLSNVLKHGRANRVEVTLRQVNGSRLQVRVADNGIGFDINEVAPERLGLKIMKERAEQSGGSCAVESKPGAGTTVIVEMPIMF